MKKNYLIFSPLLVLYLILIVLFAPSVHGDEVRYLNYAKNMAQGFYTDPDNPKLSNGPGYPLVLVPFVASNVNVLIPRALNAILVFIAVIYLYKTMLLYTNKKQAVIFAYIIGLYPPLLRWMIVLYSESLAFMLMSGFIYHFCQLFQYKKLDWKHCILASFFLGFLVNTKVIFFHVMILSAIIIIILFLIRKYKTYQKAIFVLIGGTIFIIPYLIYAYMMTGKLFYLGTQGGEILYHRSTPYENEWGNWFSSKDILSNENEKTQSNKVYQDLSELSLNHREFYLQLQPLSHIQRDSVFKAKAFENMKKYPVKYVKNTLSNIGRLLFHYPISYRSQNLNAYAYMIPNMFIVVLLILIIYPAFLARKRIPFEIFALLIFAFIYGCGMTLLSGKGRYFIIMVPSLVLFLVFAYTRILDIRIIKSTKVK